MSTPVADDARFPAPRAPWCRRWNRRAPDLEPLERVAQRRRRGDQSLDDGALVVDRQLNRDARRDRRRRPGLRGSERARSARSPPAPQNDVSVRRVENQENLGEDVDREDDALEPPEERGSAGDRRHQELARHVRKLGVETRPVSMRTAAVARRRHEEKPLS